VDLANEHRPLVAEPLRRCAYQSRPSPPQPAAHAIVLRP
jgi:hypothetical protein